MDRKKLLWLAEQLPEWKEKGWIREDHADEMKAFYGALAERKGPSLSRLFVLLLGAALIALGIFLLFAGYWYGFSPNGRFDWALVLAASALAVLGAAVWKAPTGSTYAESAAIYFMAAVGASTCLVGDTYYIGESVGLYLLLTLLLTLPVLYLLDAGIATVLYLVGATFWSVTAHAGEFFAGPGTVWLLLLLAAPMYLKKMKDRAVHFTIAVWMSWAYVGAVFGAFFFTVQAFLEGNEIFFLSSLAALTYGVGAQSGERSMWTLPFRGIGAVGILYSVAIGSFLQTWNEDTIGGGASAWIVGVLFVAASVYGIRHFARGRRYVEVLLLALPPVVLVCQVAVYAGVGALTASLFFNLYVVVVSVLLFVRGTLEKTIGYVNGAIVAVFASVAARFIDPAFSFAERGTAFVLAGTAVLAVNGIYMWRKRKRQARLLRIRKDGV